MSSDGMASSGHDMRTRVAQAVLLLTQLHRLHAQLTPARLRIAEI